MPSASNQGGRTRNVVKDTGASKKRTKEITDKAPAARTRRSASATATRQGGSTKGGRTASARATSHPGQAGGIAPDKAGRRSMLETKDRPGEQRAGRGLTKGPSGAGKQRTGTSRGGDQSRRRARGGSREDDRSE
jgi:hypothetical protein